jgi:hypothetical protein
MGPGVPPRESTSATRWICSIVSIKRVVAPPRSFVPDLLEEIDLLFFHRQATDRQRFWHWSILAPFLTGLSPIPPGAAASADLGFILIAINSERVVIITIRWRIPHGPHFGSSTFQKGIHFDSRRPWAGKHRAADCWLPAMQRRFASSAALEILRQAIARSPEKL